jgi:hypothetical protein
MLGRQCLDDLERRVRGKNGAKKELLLEDQAAFLPMPAAPFDACSKVSGQADRMSLVRFDSNDYSVPVRFAHHDVLVKGYPEKVLLCRCDTVIAEHERLWNKEDIQFDPIHCLELLERKPGALDYARPMEEWELPVCFGRLRGCLEEEGRVKGIKEYIQILRLLEKHPVEQVARAIEKTLTLRRCSRDIVAQFLYPDELPIAPTFVLDGHEHLKHVHVDTPDLGAYTTLLGGLN